MSTTFQSGLDFRPPTLNSVGHRYDAVSVLSVFVALLVVLPAHLVVGPLGAFGTPALLVGLACMGWWLAGRLVPEIGLATGPQPLRHVLLVYAWFMVLAYAIGMLRPLSVTEANGADRAVLTLFALLGVALITMDGVETLDRLETLLRRVVNGGVFIAAVGILQFFTGLALVNFLRIPGLSSNHELVAVGSRSIFNRPFATTLHPIEFGVVVAALLPLALHFAFHAPDRETRNRSWMKVAVLGTAVPMAVSRSAVVALAAAMLLLATAWNWRRRLNAAVAGAMFTVVLWGAIPGLIGTIRGLFTGLDSDASVQARLDRIPRIEALFSERPWFGRGLGTFSPSDYFLIDNEWYVSAIETGIVGIVVLLILLLTPIVIARRTGRRFDSTSARHLGYAIAASIFALFATIGTFDAFFYHIFMGLLFLLIGCAGALHRLQRQQDVYGVDETSATAWPVFATRPR